MDQNHPTLKRIHWYILILTLAWIGLAWYIFNSQYDLMSKLIALNPVKNITEQSIFKSEKKGEISFKSVEDLRRYRVGQPINLQIIADSAGVDIVGFDLLLKYDSEAFSKPIATTTLQGYTVVTSEAEDHLSITAVQVPGSENRTIFNEDEILKLVFNPLKVGTYEISIIPEAGPESTKFVSTESKVLTPQTATFQVEVY